MSEVGRLSLKIDADAAGFHNGMQGVQQKLGQVGEGMKKFGGMMTRYVTLPILGVATVAVRTAMDFEHSMAKIEALVGVSREQLGEWEGDMKRIGLEFGKLPGELADALYFITSAGLRGEEAMEVLEIASKASASGLGEVKDIASLLTFVINAYGAENITAARAADILTAAIREGALEADQLAGVMGTLMPTASALGISFEAITAGYAIMSRTGSEAAEITTMLNGVMSALLKPTPQVAKALADVGLEMSDLREIAASGPSGLIDVFRMLAEAFGDNDEALAQIFPNVRAFRAVMSMLGQDSAVVDEIIRSLTESVGILDGAWAIMSETTKQSWDDMKASVSWGLKELGEILLPMVAENMEIVTKKVIELAEAFAELDSEQQEQIIKWGGMFIAIGPVASILGNLAIFLKFVLIPVLSTPVGLVAALMLGVEWLGRWAESVLTAKGHTDDWKIELVKFLSPITRLVEMVQQAKRDIDRLPGSMVATYGPLERMRNLFNDIRDAILRAYNALRNYLALLRGNFSSGGGDGYGGGGGGTRENFVPYYFDTGGVVPGPKGAPVLAMVHGGETILPTHKTSLPNLDLAGGGIDFDLKPGQMILAVMDNRIWRQMERNLRGVRIAEAARGVG